MFRYLGCVWDRDDAATGVISESLIKRLQSSGGGWQFAIERPGLATLYTNGTSPNQCYQLQANSGAVLGKLFARCAGGGSSDAQNSFDMQETTKVIASGGQHLIQHYWGRYVAFLYDAESRTTRILRDPTGTLPCLNISLGGLEIYCSRLEDAFRLGLQFSINWDYVAAHLCCQRLELSSTGLNEVTRVLGGECVSHRQGTKTQTFFWHPLRVAESNLIEDPAEAVTTLRSCTIDIVHAWASSYRSIVHTLSGGLDSAIVLACLKDAPTCPKFMCVNYHSPGAAGDERTFARLAARHAGCSLLERERDIAISFDPLLHMPRSAAPASYRYYLENSHQECELASEQQATALFSGEGGDQLFYQSHADFGAGDYLDRRGPRRLGSEFFRIALDGARLERVTVWKVMAKAFSHAWLGHRWSFMDEVGMFTKLVPAEVIETVKQDERWMHPHFKASGRTPSGKRWHAFSLLFPALDYYDPLGILNDVERVAPLYSQPLIETCLRIPVDVLTTGGWDRAIARRAFKDGLPNEIALRRGKGIPDEYVKIVLERNQAFLREMLLDGRLIRQRLVDRKKLEAVLSASPTRAQSGGTEIYDCLSAEAWLQRVSEG